MGRDLFGDYLRATLAAEGIDQQHVHTDPRHPTGFMLKSCEPTGADPRIEYFRTGSAASHLGPADNPGSYCTGARQLHITGISVALSDSVRALVFEMRPGPRGWGASVFRPQFASAPVAL